MPQVPVYGGTQVRTAPLQPVQRGQIDVSSGMRAASQALGQVAGEIDRVVQRDAQDEAFKLEAQLRNDWNQYRAKLRDNYKADQADQYKAAADEWWKEAPQKYGSGVNPLARRLASKSLETFRLRADADTLDYVEGEKKRSRSTNYQALQQSLIQDALTKVTPATAGALGAEIQARITENAIKFATAEGTPDAGPVMAKEQLIKYHSNVALSLAGRPGGADAAKTYLSQFGGSMEIDDRTRVLDLVDAEAEKAKTKVVRDMSGSLMLGIERGQFPRKADIDALAVIDPTAAAAVQRALSAEIKARKVEAAGKEIKTDFAAWQDAYTKIRAGQPVDLVAYRDRISTADLKSLQQTKQDFGTPGKQDSLFTTAQRVEKVLHGLGIDPKKDPESAYKIGTEVDRRIRVMSTAKGGKDLLPDEVQKIVDDVALDKVYVDEWGTDPQKPIALLTPDEMAKAYVNVDGKAVKVSTVPSQDRQQIIAALRANGRPATEQAIVSLYLRGQRKPAASGTVK